MLDDDTIEIIGDTMRELKQHFETQLVALEARIKSAEYLHVRVSQLEARLAESDQRHANHEKGLDFGRAHFSALEKKVGELGRKH